MITTYKRGTPQYTALEAAAKLLEVSSKKGMKYSVEDVYFDMGQDWMWTTVIAYESDGDSWQALNPSEQALITDIGTVEAIFQAVESVRNDKYNPDK